MKRDNHTENTRTLRRLMRDIGRAWISTRPRGERKQLRAVLRRMLARPKKPEPEEP